ncbi:ribokinase [Martelella endophytica]|uniref:Ribokinase n=1 Tax=Martelella endophytica TaxID=1486262 RepID=A0A0D5LL74_MAREN|nr:ribokinase [Martelella endophytica]AJY44934.1 carbohydrate kinase [Martelella endophytica]
MSVLVLGSYAKALVMTADRIPLAGETLLGRDFRQTFGGKGSDMAVQAARLGCPVEFAGVIGDDVFGHEFVALMKEEGIGTAGLRVTEEKPTGAGLIIKDNAARNVIVVDMGANELFSPADVDHALEATKPADIALAQLEIPLETALYGLKAAASGGARTILNPAPAQNLVGKDLSMVDILTPNETEARVALGLAPDDPTPNGEIARRLMETGCRAVVMTLGEDGVFGATSVGTFTIPAFRVDHVDSNGAGDSFNAALAVGLSEGKPLKEAARFAAAVAALCCTRWETVPSYHTRDEVEAFLKQAA